MRVLIVEDEPRLAELIRRVLHQEGLDPQVCLDGSSGLEEALTGGYDVIVLDRMLPGIAGLDILAEIRREKLSTPVLMLTALAELPERIKGLDAGADDYLGKPFAFEELIARIRALGRRTPMPLIADVQQIGPVGIDLTQHLVTRGEQVIDLSPKEWAMLELLVRNRGQILSRDLLIERVWGYDADPQGNVVELYIHYLRRKLDPEGVDSPPLIRTIRGSGYMIGQD